MIKTLRRRLTLLVACVLALVTAGIVLSIRAVNLRNIDSSARAALAVLSENRGQRPGQAEGEAPARSGGNLPPQNGTPTEGETPPPPPDGEPTPPQRPGIDMPGGNSLASLSNAYTIHLDGDGTVTEWTSDRSDLYTDAQVETMAQAVLAAGNSEGRIGTQYYRLIDDGEGGASRRQGCCWPRGPGC